MLGRKMPIQPEHIIGGLRLNWGWGKGDLPKEVTFTLRLEGLNRN